MKKDAHGPYNCLASIVADAAFVRDVRRRYPTLPVLANLRCGLWYVDPNDRNDDHVSRKAASGGDSNNDDDDDAVGTCYFKSTDGHCNNWSLSATRLNVHVAEAAATRGGCVVVDATRSSTKRFPDSFSKTIPVCGRRRYHARSRGAEASFHPPSRMMMNLSTPNHLIGRRGEAVRTSRSGSAITSATPSR